MKPASVKQESESPKREQPHTAKEGPHRVETYQPGPSILSHVALEKRQASLAPSISASPTGQGDRSMLREIAETPDIAISRRPAEAPGTNIGQRLPVRTTKIVPSIEAVDSNYASSSESEESSASEYDDEQCRRQFAQRGPVRNATTKAPASKPKARVPAAGFTTTLPPVAKAVDTVQASTRLAPQTLRDTVTTEGPNHAAGAPVTESATAGSHLRNTGTTVNVAETTTVPTAPSTTASRSFQQAHKTQPRVRPVKLKEDPDAWWAKRAGKTKLSKKDQKELDDYKRFQRYGTANYYRATKEQIEHVLKRCHERIAQLQSTASGAVSSAQPQSSIDVAEESLSVAPNSEEPPAKDVSVSCSIERRHTPNLVDRLSEQVSYVVDLEDDSSEHTSPVRREVSEVRGPVNSASKRQISPDLSMLELVSIEVNALRCELQFFKGQVSAYEKTLEVDGVQLQHRMAFDAAVRKKENPQDPGNYEELASGTGTSAPSDLERQKIERSDEGRRTKVPRGDPIPSSRTGGTESQRSDPGEPRPTGQESGKRARDLIGQGQETLGANDESIDGDSEEKPSKRLKKGKVSKKEKEGQTQGELVAPLRAPDPEMSETSQCAADQPRGFGPDEEKDRQLMERIEARLSTATSASSVADIPPKSSPPQNGDTGARQQKKVLAAGRSTTAACGAQTTVRGPQATGSGGAGASNNDLTSAGATRIRGPLAAKPTPVGSASASGANKAARGGQSGSGPSVWPAGVNSIPLGPRPAKREPQRGLNTHDRRSRPWQQPYDRREVVLPDSRPRCICNLLHPYFESGLDRRPSLDAFSGTRQEFFANVEQIANCRGHDKEMIIFCEGLWASEKANRKIISQTYRSSTGMNVHLRFPEDETIPPADGAAVSRHATLPPEYGEHLKDECLDRVRRVRRNRPSPIPPQLFYGTGTPGANAPGKRKQPPR